MKGSSIVAGSPSKLATPTDLGEKVREAVASVINPLVADAFALFVKTKNYHWHVSGANFNEYHELLDQQAQQVFAMIDVLAERVRKLGGTTIRSINHIKQIQHVRDDEEPFVSAKEMIRRLLDESKDFTARMRAAHKVCSDHNDVGTTSVLENFIDEAERRTWFLFEIQAEI